MISLGEEGWNPADSLPRKVDLDRAVKDSMMEQDLLS